MGGCMTNNDCGSIIKFTGLKKSLLFRFKWWIIRKTAGLVEMVIAQMKINKLMEEIKENMDSIGLPNVVVKEKRKGKKK